MSLIKTHAELQALAERLETAARLRDAAATAPRLIEDESDILRVQRLIDSAADLRAAARCVRAMAKIEESGNRADFWKWEFQPGFGVTRSIANIFGKASGADTAMEAIEGPL